MQAVTDKFIAEQLKPRSKGGKWDIKVYAGSESKDLTPFFIIDSLSRIERRIEQDLTEFKAPDIQFSMWYDAEIWDWMQEHDEIKIKVYSGFPFEIIQKFWGYIDKDNLKKNSLGRVDVRAYGYVEYLKTIETKSIFGDPPDPSYNVPLKDTVETIFTNLGLSNQTIKILPMDTYPDAESYVLSYLQAGISPGGDRQSICRINDHKFYFTDSFWLWLIEFNADYSDMTMTIVEYAWAGDIVRIDKWDDDKFAVIIGTDWGFWYKEGANWVIRSDYKATYIYLYDASGNQLSTQAISGFTSGSYTYYPMAKTIIKYDGVDNYVIGFNAALTANPYHIERCQFRIYDTGSHALVQQMGNLTTYFIHPATEACAGSYSGVKFFFTFLGDTTDFDNAHWLKIEQTINWYYFYGESAYNSNQIAGRIESIGHYICNYGNKLGFNLLTNSYITDFWDYNADKLSRSVRRAYTDDPYQIITAYNVGANKLMIKVLDTDNIITTTTVSSLMPIDFGVREGFTYWRTYKDKPCMVGFIIDNQSVHNVGIVSNQFYPFIKAPPLAEKETLLDTLQDLAIAGCCIFDFPDDDTGIFISRAFWDEDNIYPILPLLFTKKWHVIKKLPRRVIVNSGDMSVAVGDGIKKLTISSDYIPDYDDDLGRAYAYQYHSFLSDYPYEIEIYSDFLIQYESFDLAEIMDRTGTEKYQGRLMKIIQEGMAVKIELRGKKI